MLCINLFFRVKLFFFISIIFISNCTVKYIKKDFDYRDILEKTKRIRITVDLKKSNIQKNEAKMLRKMVRNYLSHHKEFIVYPSTKYFFVPCEKKEEDTENKTEVDGVFYLQLIEKKSEIGLNISLNGSLYKCEEKNQKKVFWEGLVENEYPIDTQSNPSLIRTYTEKYGQKVGPKVNPYFLISKILLDKLDSPTLSPKEQIEKIEIEAEDD
ncbi:MAG: MXAN_6521/LA_1396 family lipoprotein [Leptospiraceae bacterium]|nr:MXAN_6521/LA_1396 family lipoprotein [Leptospiraceae bacterium]MCP5495381.1 MXAN_6521/LA_1396 family lipoprotein [Leptospiraceae bacterium]